MKEARLFRKAGLLYPDLVLIDRVMLLYLLLLFTLMPLLELWLLFKLSGVFGFWTTIGVVLATGFVGAVLARWQGWQAMSRVQNELQQGLLPAKALGDGVLILIAAVLLITPGVLTDALGLALLVPPVRMVIRKGLQLWLAKHVRVETNLFRQGVPSSDENVVEGRIVDADIVDADIVDADIVDADVVDTNQDNSFP